MVDDGADAAVVRGHRAQVGAGQPAERSAPEPATLLEDGVEDLVVGRLGVLRPRHRLGPRGEHSARSLRLVEEDGLGLGLG